MPFCPRCHVENEARLLALGYEVQPAVKQLIQADQPGWTPAQGICPRCLLEFVAQLQAQRSPTSLQPTTSPPTTFPYYHPAEETVLPQEIRLPAHGGWDGHGVTVAFLDSGYYPHPDLTSLHEWPDAPAWEQLDHTQLRAAISVQPSRLVHYVDMSNDQQIEGVDVDSLWAGSGDSWHGEMTSVTVLGNGLLSNGLYRGYAPGANGLLIKIGRGGGRIPEEDIRRGLDWLLEDDRWQRYGVRVLNVSVGGDYDEPWHRNGVSRAAEELARRGVFIAAAAGNSGHDVVLPPAQSPSVLTVGGIDDFNRRWSPLALDEIAKLELYHHNWTAIESGNLLLKKPEVLALARWLPSPILPPTTVLAEMVAIDQVREHLLAGETVPPRQLRAFLGNISAYRKRKIAKEAATGYAALWTMLRQRMNAHKWIHSYYQHVDGTSVAVAQVSALAAQMIQANPALTPMQVRTLILETALPLPHQPAERSGAGVIQPTRAVAAALRAEGGPLAGLPMSATSPSIWPAAPQLGQGNSQFYVGLWAPKASAVSVIGDFNGWTPGAWPLLSIRSGWWHGILALPPGRHPYRFWVEEEDSGDGKWLPDPENPVRVESGYRSDHSLLTVAI